MAATLCQTLGFLLSLLGMAGIMAATGMDQWATEDVFDNMVIAIFSYSGLWRSCIRQSSGLTECRPYFTILGLPTLLQAVRALMIIGIVLGAIGLLVAVLALKCLKIGNMEDKMKASMSVVAGILFLLAGVCGIAGVSAFANLIVQSFGFTSYTENGLLTGGMSIGGLTGSMSPRYTFGPALFMGWTGGAVLMVGGLLMCLACREMTTEKSQRYGGMAYKAAAQQTTNPSDTRTRTASNNNSHKTESVNTRNQKVDYV